MKHRRGSVLGAASLILAVVLLEKQNREMTIQSAMVDMTKGPLGIFAVSIAALARNGPPDLRRSTFESVAAAIPLTAPAADPPAAAATP